MVPTSGANLCWVLWSCSAGRWCVMRLFVCKSDEELTWLYVWDRSRLCHWQSSCLNSGILEPGVAADFTQKIPTRLSTWMRRATPCCCRAVYHSATPSTLIGAIPVVIPHVIARATEVIPDPRGIRATGLGWVHASARAYQP